MIRQRRSVSLQLCNHSALLPLLLGMIAAAFLVLLRPYSIQCVLLLLLLLLGTIATILFLCCWHRKLRDGKHPIKSVLSGRPRSRGEYRSRHQPRLCVGSHGLSTVGQATYGELPVDVAWAQLLTTFIVGMVELNVANRHGLYFTFQFVDSEEYRRPDRFIVVVKKTIAYQQAVLKLYYYSCHTNLMCRIQILPHSYMCDVYILQTKCYGPMF